MCLIGPLGVKGNLPLSINMYLAVGHTSQSWIVPCYTSPGIGLFSCAKESVHTHAVYAPYTLSVVNQLEIDCRRMTAQDVCTLIDAEHTPCVGSV